MLGVPQNMADGDTVSSAGGRLQTTTERGAGLRVLVPSILSIAGSLTAPRTATFPDRSLAMRGVSGTQTNNRLSKFDSNGDQTDSLITDGVTTNSVTFSGSMAAPRTKILQNTTATLAELETIQVFTADQRITVVGTGSGGDPIGLLQLENTTSSGTSGVNSSLTTKTRFGTFQLMQWENSGCRLGSRIQTNGGAGNIYFTVASDAVAMILDAAGNLALNGSTAPTASNGLLQLASGTTKASGIAYGDTFQFRYSSGGLDTNGPAATDIVNRVTRSTGEACIFAAVNGAGYIGSQSNHQLNLVTNNVGRLVIAANGLSMSYFDGIAMIFGTTTGTQLASATNQKMGFWGATPIVQQAGYGTPTGAALLTNFPGATATLAQTSGALADLLLKLKTAGLIGA